MTSSIKNFKAGDSFAIAYILLWISILIRGLWASFNEDGFAKDKLSGLILMIFALILLKIMPSQEWIPILVSTTGIVYQFVFSRHVNKEIKKEI